MERLLRATTCAEARRFWFSGFRAFVRPLPGSALRGKTAPRILDCGCGTGGNLELLGGFGRAYGFDLSEASVCMALDAGRTAVACGAFTAAPFPSAAFDLVTSFDVLYALAEADERAAVGELFRVLKPGGFALVNVVIMPTLSGDHSVLSHECRRHTRASLRRLLEPAGFMIVRLTYTNTSLFIPLALVRGLHRWRGLASEAEAQQEITVPVEPINGALLALESLRLRAIDNPFACSLLCSAKRPDGVGGPR